MQRDTFSNPSVAYEIDRQCDRFEVAWRRNEAPRIESFLEGCEAAVRPRLFSELVQLELELDIALRGVDVEEKQQEFKQRFPDDNELLDELFASRNSEQPPIVRDTTCAQRGPTRNDRLTEQTVGLLVRCPECDQTTRVPEESSLANIACRHCNAAFSLANEDNAQFYAEEQAKLAHFQLHKRIGEGAFGVVWLAHDLRLDRSVALKLPTHDQLGARNIAMLMREARAAAQLQHPNIVSVLEVGRFKDCVFVASELIEGVNLDQWALENKIGPRDAATIVAKLANALHAAHEHGVIHRDIKPSNIMIDAKGEPHLMDFGLAKHATTDATETVAGTLLGTPAYMSPEQARGESSKADGRSDVYSLGGVLFELLTGDRPFRGTGEMLLRQVVAEDAPRPSRLNSSIPRDLENICLKCLEKAPEERYPTARELEEDLQRFLAGRVVTARPVSSLERMFRLFRRHPTVASLVVIVVGLICLLTVGGPYVAWVQYRLSQRNIRARRHALRMEAKASTQAEELSRQLYLMHLAAANRAILQRDFRRGQIELDACDSRSSWEKSFLQDRIDREVMAQIPALHMPIYSNDGKQLLVIDSQDSAVAGSNDIVLWKLRPLREARRFQHVQPPTSIDLSSDQQWVACGDETGGVVVWNAKTNIKKWSVQAHSNRIDGLRFSPDNRRLATVSWDKKIRLYNVGNGELLFEVRHTDPRRAVSFSPDGKWLAVGSIRGHEAILVDAIGGQVVCSLPNQATEMPTFSRNGKLLAAAGTDGSISILSWDGKEVQTVRTWQALDKRGNLEMVKSLVFSRDGRYLLSGDQSSGSRVAVWEIATGQLLKSLDAGDTVWWLAASPTKDEVAFFTLASGTRVWSYSDSYDLVEVNKAPVRRVRISPDSRYIAASMSDGSRALATGTSDSADGTVVIDTITSQIIARLSGIHPQWTGDSSQLVTTALDTDEVELHDIQTGERLRTFEPYPIQQAPGVVTFGIPPESNTESRINPRPVRTASSAEISAPQFHWMTRAPNLSDSQVGNSTRRRWPVQIAISSDGRQVAVGYSAAQHAVDIWDTTGRKVTCTIPLTDQLPVQMRFTANGRELFIGGTGGALSRYDLTTGHLLNRFVGHRDRTFAIACSPDGEQVVAGDSSGQIIVWNVATANPLLTLTQGEPGIHSIDWSDDGSLIAAGKADGSVQFWRLPQHQESQTEQ